MTRSRQILRLFQSSVPLAFTGEGESQTHEPHYEGSLLEFHSYTDPTTHIHNPARGVCVRACAEVHADHGERTSSTGSDQDPSADLAPFLLPCHRSSSTYHDHYFHRGLRPHPANGREAARLTSSSGERSPRSPLSSLDDVPTLQFRILSNHSLQARCRCDARVGSDSGEREGEKTLPVRRSGRLAREIESVYIHARSSVGVCIA